MILGAKMPGFSFIEDSGIFIYFIENVNFYSVNVLIFLKKWFILIQVLSFLHIE